MNTVNNIGRHRKDDLFDTHFTKSTREENIDGPYRETLQTDRLSESKKLFIEIAKDLEDLTANLKSNWDRRCILNKYERGALEEEIKKVQALVTDTENALKNSSNVPILSGKILNIKETLPDAPKLYESEVLHKIAGVSSTVILSIWGFALRFGVLAIASPISGMIFGIGVMLMMVYYGYLIYIEIANTRTADCRKLIEIKNSLIKILQNEIQRSDKIEDIDQAYLDNSLYNATKDGDVNGVNCFHSHGADVNHINQIGFTPLHYAALEGDINVAKDLLDLGANINQPNDIGFTPLHYAALAVDEDGGEIMYMFLLKKGANPLQQSHDGVTPASIAESNGLYQGEDSEEESEEGWSLSSSLLSHKSNPVY